MEVIVLPSASHVGELAADIIAKVVREKPTAVLGLATGSSPLGIYAALATLVATGELDLSATAAFALDEYVGIAADHPQSYLSVIRDEVEDRFRLHAQRARARQGVDAQRGAQRC